MVLVRLDGETGAFVCPSWIYFSASSYLNQDESSLPGLPAGIPGKKVVKWGSLGGASLWEGPGFRGSHLPAFHQG